MLRTGKKRDQLGANLTLDWIELPRFLSYPSIHSYEATVPPPPPNNLPHLNIWITVSCIKLDSFVFSVLLLFGNYKIVVLQ
jgi:hypothetical protein